MQEKPHCRWLMSCMIVEKLCISIIFGDHGLRLSDSDGVPLSAYDFCDNELLLEALRLTTFSVSHI